MEKKKYAGILVKVKDKCLLCKRNEQGSHPGEWSAPAGKLEKGENIMDGALREFYEETNLEVNGRIDFCGFLHRRSRDGEKLKGLLYLFITEFDKEILPDLENAKDGEEHTECKYFKINELPDKMSEELREIIQKILKKSLTDIDPDYS